MDGDGHYFEFYTDYFEDYPEDKRVVELLKWWNE
jgi:hypothetical protein